MQTPLPTATHLPAAASQHFGVVAVILIRLDARPAEWVRVTDLAAHLGTSAAVVRPVLEELSASGLIAVHRCLDEACDCMGEIDEVRAQPTAH